MFLERPQQMERPSAERFAVKLRARKRPSVVFEKLGLYFHQSCSRLSVACGTRGARQGAPHQLPSETRQSIQLDPAANPL